MQVSEPFLPSTWFWCTVLELIYKGFRVKMASEISSNGFGARDGLRSYFRHCLNVWGSFRRDFRHQLKVRGSLWSYFYHHLNLRGTASELSPMLELSGKKIGGFSVFSPVSRLFPRPKLDRIKKEHLNRGIKEWEISIFREVVDT